MILVEALTIGQNSLRFDYRVDWQTPDKYLDAIRDVLGEIDLDPGTSERAQARIRAKTYYTRHNSCLDKHWTGRVFMNPPYTLLSEMTDLLIRFYRDGSVPEAVYLTHTLTTWEPWFQKALKNCDAFCMVDELIEWHAGHQAELDAMKRWKMLYHEEQSYDTRGSIIFYYGKRPERFLERFRKFGVVLCQKPHERS